MPAKKKTTKKAAPKYTPSRRPLTIPNNRPGESSATVTKFLTKSKDKQRSVEEISSGTGLSLESVKGTLRRLFSKDLVVRSEGKPFRWQLTPTSPEMEDMLDKGPEVVASDSTIQDQEHPPSSDHEEQKEGEDQAESAASEDHQHAVIPTAVSGITEEVDVKDLHKAEDTESGFVQ